jgi:hypothetical protein
MLVHLAKDYFESYFNSTPQAKAEFNEGRERVPGQFTDTAGVAISDVIKRLQNQDVNCRQFTSITKP